MIEGAADAFNSRHYPVDERAQIDPALSMGRPEWWSFL
jgi:hypothetical protein